VLKLYKNEKSVNIYRKNKIESNRSFTVKIKKGCITSASTRPLHSVLAVQMFLGWSFLANIVVQGSHSKKVLWQKMFAKKNKHFLL